MSSIKASIVINTKDRISRLYVVLKALEGQVDETVEVIVVFDGCNNETLDNFYKMKFSYKIIDVVSKNNVGRSAARNLGAKRATGDIIIFVDDDRVPCKDFVKLHIEGHKDCCVLLGNRKDVHTNELKYKLMMNNDCELKEFTNNLEEISVIAFDSHEKLLRKILFFKFNPVIWLVFYTGNVSLERKSIEEAGFFDENFKGWGYEDLELGYRLHKLGVKFKKSEAAVSYHLTHEISASNMLDEALKNLKYFSTKVKGNILAKLVILMLAIPLYLRILQRSFIRKNNLTNNSNNKNTN